jgi:hypothetical protein
VRAVHWACPANGRWYRLERRADLFSPIGLFVTWGGRGRGPTGSRYLPADDRDDLAAQLQAIVRRRQQRRYEIVDLRTE